MESKQLQNSDEKIEAVQQGATTEELLSEEPKAEERRLVFKLDRRILPITCLLYLFACMFFTLSVNDIEVLTVSRP